MKKLLYLLMFLVCASFVSAFINTTDMVSYWSWDSTSDSTGRNNAVAVGSATISTWSGCKSGGKCLNLTTDNNDFMNTTTNGFASTGNRSIGCWVYPTSTVVTSDMGWYYTGGTYSSNYAAFVLGVSTTANYFLDLQTYNYGITSKLDYRNTSNNWNLWTATYNSFTKNLSIYVNATLKNTTNTTSLNTSLTFSYFGVPQWDFTHDFIGYLDECFYYNSTLNSSQISNIFNGGNGSFYPSLMNSVNFTSETTQSGIYAQDWIYFRILNLTSGATSNITLWNNGILVDSWFVTSFPYQNNKSSLSDGNYTLNATNTIQSYNIIIDNNAPMLSTNFVNGVSMLRNNLTGQFNFSDTNLYSWNVSIDGVTIANATNITYSSYVYNLSYNISGLSVGQHILGVTVKDGHTGEVLKEDWNVEKSFLKNDLIFETGNNIISIQKKDGNIFDSFTAQKEVDRYTFNFEPLQISKDNTYTFLVNVKEKGVIVERENTPYKRWIITGNNWIDFYGEGLDNDNVVINQIDDYNFEVTTISKGEMSAIQFQSIGELNIYSVNYTFYVGGINITSPLNNSFNYGQYVNFTLNISGVPSSLYYTIDNGLTNNIIDICTQIQANLTSFCSLNPNGNYSNRSGTLDNSLFYDGSHLTGDSLVYDGYSYATYIIPNKSNSAYNQFLYYHASGPSYRSNYSSSIPSSCLSTDILQIKYVGSGSSLLPKISSFCYNTTEWITIVSPRDSSYLAEMRVLWHNFSLMNIYNLYFTNDGLNSFYVYYNTTTETTYSTTTLTTNKLTTNISVINLYDNNLLSTYTITDNFNDDYSFTNTSNILLLTPGVHNLDFTKTDYFTQTKSFNRTTNISIQQVQFNTSQAIAHITVETMKLGTILPNTNITLSKSSFTRTFNNGANGSVVDIYLDAGTYNVTINSSGNPSFNSTLTILIGENKYFNFEIPFNAILNLKDEKTFGDFNITDVTITSLLYCNENLTYISTITSINSTLPINCSYVKLKLNLDFGSTIGTYFRTYLNQPGNSDNSSFYLIDLRTTPNYLENNFVIDDLLKKYTNPSIWIYKSHNSGNIDITSNYVDSQNQVPAYLIQNSEYILEIRSDNEASFIYGNYNALSAGSISLRLYDIGLSPVPSGFDADVQYNIGGIVDDGLGGRTVVSTFYDRLSKTSSMTLTIYGGNYDEGHIINSITTTDKNITIITTIPEIYKNQTIIGKLCTVYSGTSLCYGSQIQVTNVSNSAIDTIKTKISSNFLNWFMIILISVIALTFTIRTSGIGTLIICGMVGVFMLLNLFVIKNNAGTTISFGVLGLASAVALIVFLKEKSNEAT